MAVAHHYFRLESVPTVELLFLLPASHSQLVWEVWQQLLLTGPVQLCVSLTLELWLSSFMQQRLPLCYLSWTSHLWPLCLEPLSS
jgi:hypothetical protein